MAFIPESRTLHLGGRLEFCYLVLLSKVIWIVLVEYIPSPGIGGGGMGGAGGCGGLDSSLLFCFGSSCCLLLPFGFCSCCLLLVFTFCSSCLGLVVLLISIGISLACDARDFDGLVSFAASCTLELFGFELAVVVLEASWPFSLAFAPSVEGLKMLIQLY
jgi:hypothetical protein